MTRDLFHVLSLDYVVDLKRYVEPKLKANTNAAGEENFSA
jgi:hypothetical protein